MKLIMLVAAGGAVGAVARYLVDRAAVRLLGIDFPWGTIAVNIVGSLLMGVLIGASAHAFDLTQEMRVFIAVGFLGSFTTFSTFSLNAVTLAERGEWLVAAGYIGGSVVLGIGAFLIGMRIWRLATP